MAGNLDQAYSTLKRTHTITLLAPMISSLIQVFLNVPSFGEVSDAYIQKSQNIMLTIVFSIAEAKVSFLWNIAGMQVTVTLGDVQHLHLLILTLSRYHVCFFLGLHTITTHVGVHCLQHPFTRLPLETFLLILKVVSYNSHSSLLIDTMCP
jgi:hypothetical protein